MSEKKERFTVTVHDRKTGRVQSYETDRFLAAFCQASEGGELWIASFRASSAQQIGEAIATILDRAFDIDQTIMEHVGPALERVPQRSFVIDYGKGDTPRFTNLQDPDADRR